MFPRDICSQVGEAILASQLFEEWLINSFLTLKIMDQDDQKVSREILYDNRFYKTPIKNLIKALDSNGHIAPDFYDRIESLLEARNLIVHRWFITHGQPTQLSDTDWRKLESAASFVRSEALALTFMIMKELLKFWELAKNGEQVDRLRQHISGIFQTTE